MIDRLRRQNQLLALIRRRTFARQEELVAAMRAEGFDVTQSAISRDLRDLGITKAAGRYIVGANRAADASRSIASLIAAVEPVGQNLIVVKTPIGAANVVALALDNRGLGGIVGTIAGDDTIFVAVRNKRAQGNVVEALGEAGMIRLTVDKIASCTKNVPLRKEIRYGREVVAKEGYVVVGRVHGEKAVYNVLENCEGRLMPLHEGDLVVGVLGHRNALQGYSGVVPESVKPGDTLHVLNLGGVVGTCTSINPEVGDPFTFEVLGSVLVFPDFNSRTGTPAHIKMNAIEPGNGGAPVPTIFVSGTSMNSGKTLAACHLIRALSLKGLKVGACKLTGVALLRDTLHMEDHGAKWAVSFIDAGVVSTSPRTAVPTAKLLLAHLAKSGADVIVAELGDGLLGQYGVTEILSDADIMASKAALLLCAVDPVGAWGGVQLLKDNHGLTVDLVSGPTTDNLVGTTYIENKLGVRALNARTSGGEMGEFIHAMLKEHAA